MSPDKIPSFAVMLQDEKTYTVYPALMFASSDIANSGYRPKFVIGYYETNRASRMAGKKSYELKDHLGNVRVVLNDFKMGRDNTGDLKSDYYLAKISSFSDYGPFGEALEARTWNGNRYRYGFNGKEKDSEWNSGGAIYDYGFRIYDPRLGRFLSIDPLSIDFPWNSPYAFAENRVIEGIDLEGLEFFRKTDEQGKSVLFYKPPVAGKGSSANPMQAQGKPYAVEPQANQTAKIYTVSFKEIEANTFVVSKTIKIVYAPFWVKSVFVLA